MSEMVVVIGHCKKYSRLTVRLFVYNNRLEDEISSNQKLSQERLAAENRIKGLEEQMTVHEDNISKVLNRCHSLTCFL